MAENTAKVLVAMSGGVDSSVAAALLLEQGYQVTGVTMRIWEGEASTAEMKHHGCYGPGEKEDIEDARKVAEILNIPFHVIDLTREYKSIVLDYFSREYLAGRTPNPCVRCNHRIKFNALIEKAVQSGLEFDMVASGHYARVEYDLSSDRYLLKKALDSTKDQSYFLSFLSQEQLNKIIFPLGNYTKSEVRQKAAAFGLPVAEKPDSQNFVCGDYSSVIKTGANPGPVMDKQGNLLGQHRGIQFYTIGQHRGLGISAKETLYVTSIDARTNTLIVGDKSGVFSDEFIVSELNWISIPELKDRVSLKAKIRSSRPEAEALVSPIDKENLRVKFKEPQMAITPGQVAVFYDDDTVVAGGIIN